MKQMFLQEIPYQLFKSKKSLVWGFIIFSINDAKIHHEAHEIHGSSLLSVGASLFLPQSGFIL